MRPQIPNRIGPARSYSPRNAVRSPLATDLSTCPKSSSGFCRILSGMGRIHNQGWRFLADYRAEEATVQPAGVSDAAGAPELKKSSPMRKRRNFLRGYSVLAEY